MDLLRAFNLFLSKKLPTQTDDESQIFCFTYSGQQDLSDILTFIRQQIAAVPPSDQSISVLFLFDSVYDLTQEQLNDMAKYLDEEYSEEAFSNFQFFLLLPSSFNRKVHVSNLSLTTNKIDFCNSKKLYQELLISIIKDERVPLLSLDIVQRLLSYFDMYLSSYQEGENKLLSLLADFLFRLRSRNLRAEWAYLASLAGLDSADDQRLAAKDKEHFQAYLQLRQTIRMSLIIIRAIYRNVFHTGKKLANLKDRVLSLILQPKSQLQLPQDLIYKLKSKEDCVQLAQKIAALISEMDSKVYKELVDRFAQVGQSSPEKKKPTGKVLPQRDELIMSGIQASEEKAVADTRSEIELLLKSFVQDYLRSPMQQLLNAYAPLVISNQSFISENLSPDTLENIAAYASKHPSTDFARLYNICAEYGREIDLKELYSAFRSAAEKEQQSPKLDAAAVNGAFLNALNELKFCGLVDEGQKLRLVLQKYFFAKTVYYNYGAPSK